MKNILAAIFCFGVTLGASAQNLTTESEDQYNRSQAARAEAIDAFRAGDLAAALDGMKRALVDRPTNIALLGNAIFLAAETGNIDDAINFADRYVSLGMVPGGGIQAKMQEKFPAASWQIFDERFKQLALAQGEAETMFNVPVEHRLVEGVTTDGNGTYFLSTVVSGTIVKVSPNGNATILTNAADHAAGSFFGLAFNAATQELYATYGRVDQTPDIPAGEGMTGVLAINPRSGAIIGNWSLPGGTDSQQIADIAIGKNGTVFVTQAQEGGIYTIMGETLERLPTDVQFRSPQGIVFVDGDTLIMADYGRGLWRINPTSGTADLLPVPETVSLIGIDGLTFHEGRLIAVQNGVSPQRIIEILTDSAFEHVTGIKVLAQNLPDFDEPTLGVSTPQGFVFVASSQWPKYGAGGVLNDGRIPNPTRVMLIKN